MIYLASPLTHESLGVMERRIDATAKVYARLHRQGIYTIAPTVASWELARRSGLPTDWNFWRPWCLALLRRCSGMYILRLPGWERSVGNAKEYVELTHDTHAVRINRRIILLRLFPMAHLFINYLTSSRPGRRGFFFVS